jgi:hypothetical protein
MATMNFSVPDDVRAAFNKAFAGTNKSALLTALMRQAVEDRQREKRRARAISRLLELRRRLRPVSHRQIAKARRSQPGPVPHGLRRPGGGRPSPCRTGSRSTSERARWRLRRGSTFRHPLSRRGAFATGWRPLDRGRTVLSPRRRGWSGNSAQRLPVAHARRTRGCRAVGAAPGGDRRAFPALDRGFPVPVAMVTSRRR